MKPLNIFPCNSDKTPATKNGFYDAAPYVVWEGTHLDSPPFWGAPTGKLNGFVVVDFDVKGGGLDTFGAFDWGSAVVVNTPSGGKHVYFKAPQGEDLGNRVRFLPGTDFRGEGGYVCLYEDVDFSALTDIPQFLLTLLQQPKKKLSDIKKDGAVEGGRNDFLTKYAGSMQRVGVLTFAALDEINQDKCSPPLDPEEVQAIVDSVKRYAPDELPEDKETPEKPIEWLSDHIAQFLEYIRNRDSISGKPTKLDDLDRLLGGGKRLGELTVTAAEAKSGKNTFWHYLMMSWLNEGTPIGYASRELDPAREVLPNLLTLALNQNVLQVEPSAEAIEEVTKNWKLAFSPGLGAFDNNGEGLFTWMDACRAHGIKYFFIDHLHLLIANSEDYKLVAELCRALKKYAVTHQVHIDLIIQPKQPVRIKQGERMVKQPMSKDNLRGGANLGQILDSLIILEREEDNDGHLTNVVKVKLDTARSKLAVLGEFRMEYDRNTMRFSKAGSRDGMTQIGNTRLSTNKQTPFIDGSAIAARMTKRLTSPNQSGNPSDKGVVDNGTQ